MPARSPPPTTTHRYPLLLQPPWQRRLQLKFIVLSHTGEAHYVQLEQGEY